MGSRVMSPASNKAVPSSEGMRAVASPPPRPHGRQRGQLAPHPFPSKAPPCPGGARQKLGRSPPPRTRSPHLPAKAGSVPARPLRRGEGHRAGSGAVVPLRRIPGALRRGKRGCPSPRGPWQPPGTVAAPVPSRLTVGPCQGGALLHTEQGRGWHAARSQLQPHTEPRFGALLP